MRLLFILLCVVLTFSCKKDKLKNENISNRSQIESIKDPVIFYDTLGKCEFKEGQKINYIKRYQYGVNNFYFFEYYDQTNRIKRIIYEPQRHPQSCAGARYDFFYKGDMLERVEVSEQSSACEIIVRTYKYNYFTSGALKSILSYNDVFTDETYFSYSPNGRVDKVYHSNRRNTEQEFRYSEVSYSYDSRGNVDELKRQNSYSIKITEKSNYIYDSVSNPFIGFYSIRNFIPFGWDESAGPFFLSKNNVRQTTHYYLESGSGTNYSYNLFYNANRITEFGYYDQFKTFIYYY